jgi:hypothetical protein
MADGRTAVVMQAGLAARVSHCGRGQTGSLLAVFPYTRMQLTILSRFVNFSLTF